MARFDSFVIQVDIPDYTGGIDNDDFVDSIETIENVYDCRDAPEDMRVKLVSCKLKRRSLHGSKNLKLKTEPREVQNLVLD